MPNYPKPIRSLRLRLIMHHPRLHPDLDQLSMNNETERSLIDFFEKKEAKIWNSKKGEGLHISGFAY